MLIDNLTVIDNDIKTDILTLIETALDNIKKIGFNEASNLK